MNLSAWFLCDSLGFGFGGGFWVALVLVFVFPFHFPVIYFLCLNRISRNCIFPMESGARWKYDVFLSFRGVDTRRGFVSHLYRALERQQGLTTFMDDRELEAGTSISLELPSAIEESQIAVVVFSPNYASSKWCLNELTNIVQCMEARDSILPIFYKVDPSRVQNQNGSFAEAFAKHEEKLISTEGKEKVKQWKAGLTKVASLCGWHSENYKSEGELIEDIVRCVWRKVQPNMKVSDSSQKLVGIDSALDQLSLLLAHDANDVRFIGITGMGGIGKTTLAKLVFDRISHRFEVLCFLANVREVSARDGNLFHLQKQLLFPFFMEKIAEVWVEQYGVMFAEKCLSNKKVLLVLDNVDQLSQLANLAGKKDWFGMGSRIIITTRNARLLVEHGITMSYKVEGLDYGDALKLFSRNAFRKDQPEEDFLELSKCFLHYADGLPLALKSLGCSLYMRDRDAWNSMLDNLKKIQNPTIFDSLKISYDALEETEKSIFLDVACFQKGKCKKKVIEALDNGCVISSCISVDLLIERSLFTLSENTIQMHDLVQEMAWEIVRRDSKELGQRSRLWLYDDICHVFRNNTGTGAVEAIVLRSPELKKAHHWNCEALSKMHNLRILVFDNVIISSTPNFLPYSLRIMHWSWYPSKFLPVGFQPDSLTELRMRYSNLVRFWDGTKNFPKLKILDAMHSVELTNTPDFSGLPNLEELHLTGCKNLVEIHPSIAFLKRLKFLSLACCTSIESLPSEVQMDSLECFFLCGCIKLKKIPEFGPQMRNLSKLTLSWTAIEKIPSSIENLAGLTYLDLCDCKNLVDLSSAVCKLKYVKSLDMEGCSKVDNLTGELECLEDLCLTNTTLREPLVLMKNLKYLYMSGLVRKSGEPPHSCGGLVLSFLNRLCSLEFLYLRNCNLWEVDIPVDIGHGLSNLRKLDLRGNNFVKLPGSIRCLSKLEDLDLKGCKRLQQLPDLGLSNGRRLRLNVDDCTSLERLSDISKLSNRSANLFNFSFRAANCFRLIQDEAWNHALLSWGSYADEKWFEFKSCVFPGNEIPEWFSNQSVGCSINTGIPPESCTNWLGIAFCLVFAQPNLSPGSFTIQSEFFPHYSFRSEGSIVSDHLWVFYLSRQQWWNEGQPVLSFTTSKGRNWVKKCGARVVYEQDVEELITTMTILKRPHEHSDEADDEAAPPFGSFDDNELLHCRKRLKQH